MARVIAEARAEAGLAQWELVNRIATKPPVIARLADADREGHSRIGGAGEVISDER